jgi:segregation and condensation protein A
LQPRFDFQATDLPAPDEAPLIVELDGYEGPLDVLLALARAQKVDLLKLSILQLADQYLAFVRDACRRHLVLAADYLVMAAWLALLKSRLLLPRPDRPPEEQLPAEEVAAELAFRIAKLDAMRRACEALRARPLLRREVFMRGDPQAAVVVSHTRLEGDLRSLMEAYVQPRTRVADRAYRPRPAKAYGLEEARDRLRSLLPALGDWTTITGVAPDPGAGEGPTRASCIASTLSASLELVREGDLDVRQLAPFEDLYLRARRPGP